MIELTLTELAVTAAIAAFILVGGFSLISRGSRRAEEHQSARRCMLCRICGHVWEDDSREEIAACPACGAPNRKGRDRRLG